MQWIKGDWDFGVPMAKLTVSHRRLAANRAFGDTMAADFLSACTGQRQDPHLVEACAMALIERERPDLKGGCLVWINLACGPMRWQFTYVHPSLPRRAQCEEAEELELTVAGHPELLFHVVPCAE